MPPEALNLTADMMAKLEELKCTLKEETVRLRWTELALTYEGELLVPPT